MRTTAPSLSASSPDEYVRGLIAANPEMLVPHFLIHSYLYYVEDNPIVSDACFDEIVQGLRANWKSLKHRHKALIDPSILKSGFYLKYPGIVIGAACALLHEFSPSSL